MDPMFQEFLIEAEELFDEAERALSEIGEKGQKDASIYQTLFRSFHSLKGASAMFELKPLQEHMHKVEGILVQNRDKTPYTDKFKCYFLGAVDSGRDILEGKDVDFNYEFVDSTEKSVYPSMEKQTKQIAGQMRLRLDKKFDESLYTRKGLVFVCDDDEEIVELESENLESVGYSVKGFTNPETMLDILKSEHPDVIISDINMPQMSGLELAKKSHEIYPALPVIIVSGFVSKENCIEFLNLGISGILEKPIDFASLIQQVNHCRASYRAYKLLNRSLDLLIYQFQSLEAYLVDQGREDERNLLRSELSAILKAKSEYFVSRAKKSNKTKDVA